MGVLWLDEVDKDDVPLVGGKGANLGELLRVGIPVPEGFVVDANTFKQFIESTGLKNKIMEILNSIDVNNVNELEEASKKIRKMIEETPMPKEIEEEIKKAYRQLCEEVGEEVYVAVRSSATAEDLPSVAEDEFVLVKINGFVRLMSVKDVYEEFHKGSKVEIPAMKDGKVVWAEVKDVYKHNGYGKMLKIKTKSGREIVVSPNHSIILLDEKKLEPYVVPYAKDVVGKRVPVTAKIETNPILRELNLAEMFECYERDGRVTFKDDKRRKGLPKILKLDEDTMFFFGLFLADGTVDLKGRCVVVTSKHKELVESVMTFAKKLGLKASVDKRGNVRIYSIDLVEFMTRMFIERFDGVGKGKTCKTKRIPDFVFNVSESLIGNFLAGLFDGDGYVGDEISLTTTSKLMCVGIVKLLEMLGIAPYIREKNGYYTIYIPKAYLSKFAEKIPLRAKADRLREVVEKWKESKKFDFYEVFQPELEIDLPKVEKKVAFCPICGSKLSKTSKYKGRERYLCKSCRKTFYSDEVKFKVVDVDAVRDLKGRFKSGIVPHNAGKFSRNVGKRKLMEIASRYGLNLKFVNDELLWDVVEDVDEIEYSGVVYDFVIPEIENFACGLGGIITHNSASFAGQQETYLNVKGEDEVVDKVKKCWSSLYTPRAIFYRVQQGFRHEDVSIAVVVQKMVNSEKSGVMFTSHPITGEKIAIIEAVFGLGEAIVSGEVTPDHYEYDRIQRKLINVQIAYKKFMLTRQDGKTVRVELGEKGKERVLSDQEIEELVKLGEIIEEHYGHPQDVEWAIEKGKIYIVQSRPITTIKGKVETEEVEEGEILVKGLGASPGIGVGKVKIVLSSDEINKVEEGDVLVTTMTTPDMVPAMRKASAIVTDEGGLTCHAAIVSRELGIPAVVGTGNATKVLKEGMIVTVDGDKGLVYKGALKEKRKEEVKTVAIAPQIITATEVKVNLSIPDVAEKVAKETNADGVGLLRIEHMVLSLKKHPMKYIKDGEIDVYIDELYRGLKKVVKAFYPKPVWIRTLDAPTDEFRSMEGGENEPVESNPMLGYRGIRRDLKEEMHFRAEMRAIKKLIDEGYTNIGIMLPLVTRVEEVKRAKEIALEEGIPLDKIDFGIMVETPACALIIEDIIRECGITFISFGTNDLTQYTLAVDRNNENVAYLYSEKHPAVLKLIEHVINVCKKYGVKTSICGQAGSDPKFAEMLVKMGIDSISANPDAVQRVREAVARIEKKLILEKIRNL